MHDRETNTGLLAVLALEVEREMKFDWDQELRVSARTREALELIRVALERYDTVGQPLWPVGFGRGRGGGDCGFIIHRPAAARARSWRRLRRGDGCPAAVAPGH